jgi:hypothetical protein
MLSADSGLFDGAYVYSFLFVNVLIVPGMKIMIDNDSVDI